MDIQQKPTYSIPQDNPSYELEKASLKLECLKLAAKHTFSYEDLLKQGKELIQLLGLTVEDFNQITRQAI